MFRTGLMPAPYAAVLRVSIAVILVVSRHHVLMRMDGLAARKTHSHRPANLGDDSETPREPRERQGLQ